MKGDNLINMKCNAVGSTGRCRLVIITPPSCWGDPRLENLTRKISYPKWSYLPFYSAHSGKFWNITWRRKHPYFLQITIYIQINSSKLKYMYSLLFSYNNELMWYLINRCLYRETKYIHCDYFRTSPKISEVLRRKSRALLSPSFREYSDRQGNQ
jgi:hypothetical protein